MNLTNKTVNIKYNSDFKTTGIITALLLVLAAIYFFLFKRNIDVVFIVGFGIGITIELYKSIANYITVKNGCIKKDFGRSIKLTEVAKVIRYADSYSILSDQKEIVINPKTVHKKSLQELETLLLDLERSTGALQ